MSGRVRARASVPDILPLQREGASFAGELSIKFVDKFGGVFEIACRFPHGFCSVIASPLDKVLAAMEFSELRISSTSHSISELMITEGGGGAFLLGSRSLWEGLNNDT
jgi:hypothetical protein